jgi:hypothetical protein
MLQEAISGKHAKLRKEKLMRKGAEQGTSITLMAMMSIVSFSSFPPLF